MELANAQHEAFAQHVANGLSLTEAAKRAGYAESSAHNAGSRVAQLRAVSQRIDEIKLVNNGRSELVPAGIRSPQGRVTALADRWERMRLIIAERSNEYEDSLASENAEVIAGGKSGLLVKEVRKVGTGDKAQVFTTYRLDRELLAELRAHEQQAAEELGQWSTRKEVYTQSLNFSLMDTTQLHKALSETIKNAPAGDRAKLLAEAPELAELVEAIPESPALNDESTPEPGV